jgi:hypothetical protein
MEAVTTIGLDIAKSVFQVHCVDASGAVAVAPAVIGKRSIRQGRDWAPRLVEG